MAKPIKPSQSAQPQKAAVPTRTQTATVPTKAKASVVEQRNDTLVFGRETFKWMLIGLGIMAVGFICMTGGSMPSPDVWDESLIYSSTRTVIAPFLIMVGLGVQVYAIFKKN
jgi:Protein of unknown function (DUF3098)